VRLDLARINHILIPKSKEERDRFRRSLVGRAAVPIVGLLWGSLTDEGRTLLIVTPIAGGVAIDVLRTSAYYVFAILAGVLLGSLIASRGFKLARTTVRVTAPRRVTIGEDVTFSVSCHREAKEGDASDAGALPVRVRGPFLPWDGTWMGSPPDEMLVGPGDSAVATMRARFVSRGLHHLDSFTAAAVVPLGLACGPRVASDGIKVYVVPRIANVVRLPLALGTKHQPGGVALASKAGESMDLLGVRPYRPGDPVRDLHARTWARTGSPAVREYQQEYFTRVGVVLDTSARDPDRLEAAIELAAGVIAFLSRGEALIDVLVVGDDVHELTLGRSLGRLDQALELLSSVERGPDLHAARLVTKLEPHLAQLSTVFAIFTSAGSSAANESEQKLLERKLNDQGLSCTTIIVDDELTKAIKKREALSW